MTRMPRASVMMAEPGDKARRYMLTSASVLSKGYKPQLCRALVERSQAPILLTCLVIKFLQSSG